VNYPKPALTFVDQAALLALRGLGGAPDEIAHRLAAVSYYRLSAYWYPFRLPDDSLRPGTTIEIVWRRYVFDRQLRLLVLDAIERVEIAIRTLVVNQHTLLHGPFGYLDRANLPNLTPSDHGLLLRRLREEAGRSREDFVSHFFGKYTSETDLPLWMACELMTFGGLLTLFRGLATPLKQSIARSYGVSDTVLDSWLLAINQIRNLCAHHARLWNRVLGVKPMIPRQRKHPQWHVPVAIPDDRIFGCLTVLRYLLRITAPSSQWQLRLQSLLSSYPEIPIREMGFPADWTDSPLWQT
jgi:abortive infection bacteriophage resistance protein